MAQQPRMVHLADAQDERVALLSLSAAHTYAYLPTVLDDAGRAKEQPAVLNGFLWPLRVDEHGTEAMAADLDALTEAGLVCRYTVDEQSYIHDPEWRARQRITQPASSTLPPCPVHETATDDTVGETLRKVSEQINSFVSSAMESFDETKVRDAVSRAVEDVTFLIDPEKAATYGQKVREFLGDIGERPSESEPDLSEVDVWEEITDDPDARR